MSTPVPCSVTRPSRGSWAEQESIELNALNLLRVVGPPAVAGRNHATKPSGHFLPRS
jgi:hypothetical protein